MTLFVVNYTWMEDKFINSILHIHRFSHCGDNNGVDSKIYNTWRLQSDFEGPNGFKCFQ